MEIGHDVTKSNKKLIGMVMKLEPQEFIGVCKILGVEIYNIVDEEGNRVDNKVDKISVKEYAEALAADRSRQDNDDNDSQDEEPAREPERKNVKIQIRQAEDMIADVITKISQLNRTQSRNLMKILKPATKGR